MSIIGLQLTSFVYIVLLNIVYFSKNRLSNLENNIYKKLLLSNILGLLIEFGCFFSVSHMDVMPIFNMVITKLLLVYYFGFIMLYTYYVFIVSYNNENVEQKEINSFLGKIKGICWFVFIVNSIVMSILPMEYYRDSNYVYSYGTAVNYLALSFMIVMGIWLIVLLKNFKNIKGRKYLPIIIFIVLAGIAGYIQTKYPQLLLTTPIETFVVFLMFFTIENPDMRMITELNRTKKMIEQTNADKSKFLFNVTEEMKKTIDDVSVIVNKVVDSSNEVDTKEAMYKLRYILSNSKMKLNQTLDISTIDYKNIKLVNNTYDFKTLVKEVSLRLKKEIPAGVMFKTNISDSVPNLLYGESVKIKQILTTLIHNAFKYTKEGYVELRCNTIIKNNACRLIITVEDTGCGMDLHEINDILINDTNLTDSDLEKYNELELNLKIVKKIIQIIGGTFNIESDKDKGTKVVITIDQVIVEEEKEDLKDIKKMEDQIFNKKKIAVISDNNNISKKVLKALGGVDALKIECKHAKECLDRIRKDNDIDVIICQEDMDKIDARGLLSKISKEEKNVPIIMITSLEDYDLKRIKLEGFASCLNEKEISLELVKKVERIINK